MRSSAAICLLFCLGFAYESRGKEHPSFSEIALHSSFKEQSMGRWLEEEDDKRLLEGEDANSGDFGEERSKRFVRNTKREAPTPSYVLHELGPKPRKSKPHQAVVATFVVAVLFALISAVFFTLSLFKLLCPVV
uniref:Small integral membrane protein 17 n=1 Tax=Steinernema glaseri TaxID=37863 RepID=A0A1I7YFS9_9BILA